jgi:hypothetical protein
LQKEDLYSVNQNDVFYVTKRGRDFNWQYYVNCFDKVKRLGSGGFGTVYLLRNKIN